MPTATQKIGLIAGNGRFPFLFLKEAAKAGAQVVVIGLKEEADPTLAQEGSPLHWVNLGQLGKLIEILKKEGVDQAVMAGQVKHTQLFSGITPDWRALKLLKHVVNKKTDTLLGAVTEELASEGIRLLPSVTFLSHLLPKAGVLSKRKPTDEEKKDMVFGHKAAKALAGQDLGQTVTVKDQAVIAVEAMEGTDACILRSSPLVQGQPFTVVKVAKPKQDFRFDVPVIGPRTMETMKQAGAQALALEAGRTLLIDQEQLIAAANEHGIAISVLEETL